MAFPLKNEPNLPHSIPKEQEAALMTKLWEEKPIHQKLFMKLKQEVLRGPVCLRLNFKVRFYLKTDFCKDGMASVLMQPDSVEGSIEAMENEAKGGHCKFDITKGGLRLRPILFICQRAMKTEHNYHFHSWAMEKIYRCRIPR
jgi:hypothetical protein